MKRPSAWTLALSGMVLLLLGIAAASFLQGPRGEDVEVDSSPPPPCPVGFIDRIGEADRTRARLRSVPAGAATLDALRVQTRFCFGEIDVPVVSEGRVLVLDGRASLDERAARVGHLLHHIVEGMPFPDEVAADADCEAIVETAIEREATAYTLEVELRRAYDLQPPRYEFERDFWRAPEGERREVVERYLRAHPDGAPNMDPLISAYTQRCEVERSEAR